MTGRIEVICGPMYSGKTSALLHRLRYCEEPAIAFKPDLDKRYHDTRLVTHDGEAFPGVPLSTNPPGIEDVFRRAEGVSVVGIDECQFFSPALIMACESLARRGVRVICAGLDLDYRGHSFGPMGDLMSVADEVTKITAKCQCCGKPASRTYKTRDSSELIEVGSFGLYEARCRSCWAKA